ncbi:MAG: phosphatidate cytidylyltransferase [Gammaproteobacteria bacterium]|nr:phosphatidate cytidylyltransferase [Gammaproteobacteria bacterium]
MLKQRIITAVLLLPLVGFLLFGIDLATFAVALVIVAYLMALEWGKLSGLNSTTSRSFYALVVSLIALGIWYWAPALYLWPSTWFIEFHFTSTLIIFWLAIVGWFVAALMIFISKSHRSFWAKNLAPRLIMGVVLILGFWVSAVALRGAGLSTDPYKGGYMVLFMLTIIWGADIGGYIFGKLFGRNKLAPTVSPGKTWEGVAGGVGLSLGVAIAGSFLLGLPIQPIYIFIPCMIALVFIAIIGDLFESLLKREVQVKDSSNLLPGHGGLLDRLDSTIAVAPFFLLTAKVLGWI